MLSLVFFLTIQCSRFHKLHFWEFLNALHSALCRLLLLIKIFDHTKVSWQYDVRCFFFMVYHCCPGIQRISACVTRINERRLNLISWIQILILAGKKCAKSKKFKRRTSRLIIIHFWYFLLSNLNSKEIPLELYKQNI